MRVLVLMAVVLASATVAQAQTKPWAAPRTAFGAPDLQGVWTNASITKLTRSTRQPKLVVTPEEAAALAKSDGLSQYKAFDARPTDPNKGAPISGQDPGGYNAFWLDAGSALGKVKGEYRTSWIVDPADGQLPLSAQGKALVAKSVVFAHEADTPSDPESLQPWDRCIISSRGSGGPGMLNNIYNSNYQIVQTPTAVAIAVEMVHDVRSIPIFPTQATAQAGHGPAVLQPWLGDSTGWWEGDTLVIETVNVNREQGRAGPIFLTPQGKVTERLRRASPTELYYEFTVEDPTYYSRPWRAEMTLTAGKDPLYEYACHEGNYAMPHILAGARAQEKGGKGSAVGQ
jgi:hypothetical protein